MRARWVTINTNTINQSLIVYKRNPQLCTLDVDIQGVLSLKGTDLHPYYVFVAPPSIEVKFIASFEICHNIYSRPTSHICCVGVRKAVASSLGYLGRGYETSIGYSQRGTDL